VTVFEKNDRIGGLLRYGIPDFKLEKAQIDRRVEQMRAEGVTFVTGVLISDQSPQQWDAPVPNLAANAPNACAVAGGL
jgi:NADPH-dependent glutamate synthase beta subunit-like oxidoreductase